MNIFIFTRTSWSEFPRLRHQVALLLAEHGHQVTFFEKPDKHSTPMRKISSRLTVVAMPEIIHHQLRPFRFISDWANGFPAKLIKSHLRKLPKPDIIINFNYYFYFLKKILPDVPVCSIINDDFVAQGKSWMKKSIASQIKDTCKSSDTVLTVSYPLLDKLSPFNEKTFLFFPWADKKYSLPEKNVNRNTVLYFGHINHRLNFPLIDKLASAGISLRLIGPVQRTVDKAALKKLLRYKNVSLLPPVLLPEVDFSDVCCSILPYDLDVVSVHACSVSNRSFNLLSYGIPLLIPKLSGGIPVSPDVISYCCNINQYLERIEFFKYNFYLVQEKIRNTLKGNVAEDRYQFLYGIFNMILDNGQLSEPLLHNRAMSNEILRERTV